MPQTFAYTSGPVLAIPITITPMIAGALMLRPAAVRVQNTGAETLLVEVAFSFDGVTFIIYPMTAFGGPDGPGVLAGGDILVALPELRPPYIRLRAQAAQNTTNAQIDVYEWPQHPRGRFTHGVPG